MTKRQQLVLIVGVCLDKIVRDLDDARRVEIAIGDCTQREALSRELFEEANRIEDRGTWNRFRSDVLRFAKERRREAQWKPWSLPK